MDTVSNGGFLPFSAGGILSPLPGELARDYGPYDYDTSGTPGWFSIVHLATGRMTGNPDSNPKVRFADHSGVGAVLPLPSPSESPPLISW